MLRTIAKSREYLLWLFLVLAIFAQFYIIFYIQSLKSLGLENNTYLRIEACVISVSPLRRTADYVRYCYASAEKSNITTVDHYGDGK